MPGPASAAASPVAARTTAGSRLHTASNVRCGCRPSGGQAFGSDQACRGVGRVADHEPLAMQRRVVRHRDLHDIAVLPSTTWEVGEHDGDRRRPSQLLPPVLAPPVQVVGLEAADEHGLLRRGAALVFDRPADRQHRALRQRGDRKMRPPLAEAGEHRAVGGDSVVVDRSDGGVERHAAVAMSQDVADLLDVTTRVAPMAAVPPFRGGESIAPLPGPEQGDAHLRLVGDIADCQGCLECRHDVQVIMT